MGKRESIRQSLETLVCLGKCPKETADRIAAHFDDDSFLEAAGDHWCAVFEDAARAAQGRESAG